MTSGQMAGSSGWTTEKCGHEGGVGIGAGHRCVCTGSKGHAPFHGVGHGCSWWGTVAGCRLEGDAMSNWDRLSWVLAFAGALALIGMVAWLAVEVLL